MLQEPWKSFLGAIDERLSGPADLHCIGGFAVSQHYGFPRQTADLDLLSVSPLQVTETLLSLAGRGSGLHHTYKVHLDVVGVAEHPDGYQERIVRVFPYWPKLRLWALEAHDLALTKLDRSNERDIRDVMFLAEKGLINRETLLQRFEKEMRPYLSGRTPTWHDSTLRMWCEACWPEAR